MIKAFVDENGGIGIEYEGIPHLFASDRLVCLKCGHEFFVSFKVEV